MNTSGQLAELAQFHDHRKRRTKNEIHEQSYDRLYKAESESLRAAYAFD